MNRGMTTTEKVEFILKAFYSKNENSKEPKLWKMDTCIYNTLERTYKSIYGIKNIKEIKIIEITGKEQGERRYSLYINEKNITPAKNKDSVTKNTIVQYLKIFFWLGIITLDTWDSKIFKNKIIRYDCSSSFFDILKNIIDKKENKKEIIGLISKHYSSKDVFKKNISFSIFIYFISYWGFDFETLWINNELKFIDKKNKIKKRYANTYKSFVKEVFTNFSIDKFVQDVYESIKGDDLWNKVDLNDIKEIEKMIREYNQDIELDDNGENIIFGKKIKYICEVLYERSKFRKCIIKDRKSKGLIRDKKDEYYSDLENDDSKKKEYITAKIEDLEACHIFQVLEIKNWMKNKKDPYKLKCVSNPNNGLLMPVEYHDLFDKNYFNFDNLTGKMIFEKKHEEYLFKVRNLNKCRIKKEIFSDEMKEMLKRRKVAP